MLFFAGQISMSLADLFFLGRLPSNMAITCIAALGPALLILWCAAAPVAAIAASASTVMTDLCRRGDERALGAVFINATLVATLLAIAAGVGTWFVVEPVLDLTIGHSTIAELATTYTNIRLLALPAVAGLLVCWSLLDAIDRPEIALWVCLLMNGLNVGLNAMLVFGAGPVPGLGIEGAAAASLLSTTVAVVAIGLWPHRDGERSRFHPSRLSDLSIRRCGRLLSGAAVPAFVSIVALVGALMLLRIVALSDQAALSAAVDAASRPGGISAILSDWLVSAPNWTAHAIVADWPEPLATSRPPLFLTASTLVLAVLAIFVAPLGAVGHFTRSGVERAVEIQNYDHADALCWDSLSVTLVLAGIFAVVLVVLPGPILTLFSPTAPITAAAVPILRLMAAQLPFIAMIAILSGAYLGTRRSWIAVLALLLGAAAVPVSAYLVGLVFSVGFVGVWWAAALMTASLAIFLALTFWLGIWKPVED